MPKSKQRSIKNRVKKGKNRRAKRISIEVRRSSGRKEKFDLDKMAQTTSRSGVPFIMARDIAKKVTKEVRSEARSKGKDTTITAGRLKKMIHAELKNRNQKSIASSYSGQKPENRLEGQSEVKEKSMIENSSDTNVMYDRSKRLASAS